MKVLFDTDPGVDDAAALLLLARSPEIELLGITTVQGNADIETVTRNARYLSTVFGIEAPIGRGAARPLVRDLGPAPAQVHGANGLGDVKLDESLPLPDLDPRPAHQMIADTLRTHPGDVTIIAVGRLTNLALMLMHDPAAASLARQVVIMGGAYGTEFPNGNVTPVAEANISGDPHAADQVFAAPWPIVAIGLDVTRKARLTRGDIEALANSGDPATALVGRSKRHYANYHRNFGLDGCYIHDSSAVAYALHPEWFELKGGPVTVVPDGIAAGQTIQYADGALPRPSLQVAVGVDAKRVSAFMVERLSRRSDAGRRSAARVRHMVGQPSVKT